MAFSVSGSTRSKITDAPIASCPVYLLKYDSGSDTFTQVASGTSGAGGDYSLTAADGDPLHCVVAFDESGSPVLQGATRRDVTPATV